MANKYYTPPPQVIDGDVAFAIDVNGLNSGADSGFDAVQADYDALVPTVEYWADIAKQWAESALEVEPGQYSAKYHAEASALYASDSLTSAGESAASAAAALASQGAALASETAAAASALAAYNSEVAAGISAAAALVSEGNASDSADEAAASAAAAAGEVAAHAALTTGVHGLGTASQEDMTVSDTDSTVGRVLKVGDFGLGYRGTTPSDIDDASSLYTGFYQSTDGVNGTYPPNSDKYGTLLVQRRHAGSQTQYFSKVSTNQVWTRHFHSSAWSDWQRVMQSEDVTQSNTDTTLDLLLKTGDWGIGGIEALQLPAGTELERPTVPVEGQLRYNEDIDAFEGYQAGAWASVGGGASGAPQNPVFYENDTNVTGDYTITSGKNAMSAGPITVDGGVNVTVPVGSVWTIV